eukprot:TRINITY_DN1280_c0_g1_i1.p1 TRINITY_DN1280_c0_g1~~TRINITY_DN1280_c0_g1_i1.p1  ORF type:complete len:1101 (-),score=423.01 TRINITY_DN1280_c0_g1_i1:24-3326(-)
MDPSKAPTPAAPEIDEEKKRKADEKKKAKAEEKAAKEAKFKAKQEQVEAEKKRAAEKKKAEAEKKSADPSGASSSASGSSSSSGVSDKAAAGDKKLRLKKEYVNPTPVGQKKDTAAPLDAAYDPPTVEAAWYDWWQQCGFFNPEKQVALQQQYGYSSENAKENFTIVIPPPNVTGSLHLGHALTNAVQDALVRYHRMRGFRTLWVPGTDHAGIATQVTVEKRLARERGVNRHDLGREAFIKEVWKWKEEYGGKINIQLRRLGSSLDWSREVFTMDEDRSKAVTEAFVRFYQEGLLYRDTRLVNWDSNLRTAISDVEVDYIDLDGPKMMTVPGHGDNRYEFGVLIEFAYKVDGSDKDELVVATTRVETMLADTAVAIHPNDPRYKHLHGKFVVHPFHGTKIPIICDDKLVDMNFGTGVVKVTPAHDPNDYECGLRHSLPMPTMLTLDGKVNAVGGQFEGLLRFDARNAVIKALEEKGLYRGKKPNPMRLGVCSRSNDVIEPRLMPQWWVKCDGLGARALQASNNGDIEFYPASQKDAFARWLSPIRDWCISRQLWWGHRIPAYLVQPKNQAPVDSNSGANWVVARSHEEALKLACQKTGLAESDLTLEQDPDVLDTWFSSGLFPFSVMGWPEKTQDLQTYYPTSILETGQDILFFWVVRMIIMGQQLTGSLPFSKVMLHAMVRDAHGRKMSKALGNVIDPLDVTEGISLEDLHAKLYTGNLDPKEIENAKAGQREDFPNGIGECGTDAMRFALCAYTSQARDINLDIKRVEGYRNFCNKIWNATKLVMLRLGAGFTPAPCKAHGAPLAIPAGARLGEQWILDSLARTVQKTEEGFQKFDFSQATSAIFAFWKDDFCDVYLETIKPILQEEGYAEEVKNATREVMYTCIDVGLRLLHPFMPFLTEELYQRIPRRPGDQIPTIMLAPFPSPAAVAPLINDQIAPGMTVAMDIVRSIRSVRSSYNVVPSKRPKVVINCTTPAQLDTAKAFTDIIKTLSLSGSLEVVNSQAPEPGFAVNVINETSQVYVDIKDLVDVDAEITKLEARRTQLENNRDALAKKINNPQFSKAPANVQEDTTSKFKALEQEIETTKNAIDNFRKLSSK